MYNTTNNGLIIQPSRTHDVAGKGDDTLPSIITERYRPWR